MQKNMYCCKNILTLLFIVYRWVNARYGISYINKGLVSCLYIIYIYIFMGCGTVKVLKNDLRNILNASRLYITNIYKIGHWWINDKYP